MPPNRDTLSPISPYRYNQGKAFTAARRQSCEQINPTISVSEDIADLTKKLDGSPRKAPPKAEPWRPGHGSRTSQESGESKDSTKIKESFNKGHKPRKSADGLVGSRLMRSASGLGFDEGASKKEIEGRGCFIECGGG